MFPVLVPVLCPGVYRAADTVMPRLSGSIHASNEGLVVEEGDRCRQECLLSMG